MGMRVYFIVFLFPEGRGISAFLPENSESLERACGGMSAKCAARCASRGHYRLSWEQRLARNARRSAAPEVSIKLFGIPDAFATALGLRIA